MLITSYEEAWGAAAPRTPRQARGGVIVEQQAEPKEQERAAEAEAAPAAPAAPALACVIEVTWAQLVTALGFAALFAWVLALHARVARLARALER